MINNDYTEEPLKERKRNGVEINHLYHMFLLQNNFLSFHLKRKLLFVILELWKCISALPHLIHYSNWDFSGPSICHGAGEIQSSAHPFKNLQHL